MDHEKVKVEVLRLRKNDKILPLPIFQTSGASGCDLRADVEEAITLKPKEIKLIPTGIAISIPRGFEGQVRPRSGWASRGVTVVNAPGTIDADYRGEIKVLLINLGEEEVSIERGDRIAQLVIQRVYQIEWEEVDVLDPTVRAEGGFGHTGKGMPHSQAPHPWVDKSI